MNEAVDYFLTDFPEALWAWVYSHGVKILFLLLAGIIIHRIAHRLVERTVRRLVERHSHVSKEAENKREDTLIEIFHNTFIIMLWLIIGMMILAELGIAIAPILAAAGVAGLAFGFGGQYLIRDIISGLFVITENQYRVGDIICLGDTCGQVSHITLRMTTLRDLDGVVHYVPNGEIKTTSNMSQTFSRINLDIGVGYGSDLDQVIGVINRVGAELAEDPDWKTHIIEPPKFLRVESFGDSAIDMKILGDVQPAQQWAVAGELRKRLKLAFDEAGIEIPFPQRVIHQPK